MAKDLSETVDGLKFPLAKGAKQPQAAAQKQPARQPIADSALANRVKEALAVPIPGRSDYWNIEDLSDKKKNDGVFARFLKKKAISAEEIMVLKKEAVQSPGNTRAKIQKLKKQFPNNSELYMLSAICTNGMLLNSSNRDEVVRGLKYAVREGAIGLTSNGVSLYNCESFFKIYFVLIDRFKRDQARTLGLLSEDPRLRGSRNQLDAAIKAADFLYNEKSKVSNIINHLKKKLKSSNYIALFNPPDIQKAAQFIEKGTPKEQCKIGTAAEMISYLYAITLTFAHTPLLSRLVAKILSLLPDKELSLFVRKISISSVRRFCYFKLALAEQDRDEMMKIANTIIKENTIGLSKWGNATVHHSYEADMFFNLAYVAELTPGIFPTQEFLNIVDKAIKAMETLAEKDVSKGHVYTESANAHLRKLTKLKEDKSSGSSS